MAAYVAVAQNHSLGARFVLRAVNAVETLVAAVVRWNQRRETRIALMSLSDEILADIGVDRASL